MKIIDREKAPSPPVDVEYHLREGDAAGEILRLAGQLRPDLIVVGTHGRTGLSWLLAGSVATSVVRRALCPVLALHPPERRRHVEDIRVILHPTDFSKGCESSLRVARSLAREYQPDAPASGWIILGRNPLAGASGSYPIDAILVWASRP